MNKILIVIVLLFAFSCEKKSFKRHDDYTPDTGENNKVAISDKPRYLWYDASANFQRFSSEYNIEQFVKKASETGFTDIVVDVRPVVGDVLYNSVIVPKLEEWKGIKRNLGSDYLNLFIKNAKKYKLKVHVSMNVFSGGHNYFNLGEAYVNPKQKEWTTQLYTPVGMMDIKDYKSKYSAFYNPVMPEVQEYNMKIIKEVVLNYDVDGIILDRCRFDGIASDFSDFSKKEFEKYIGENVTGFPESVFTWKEKDINKLSVHNVIPGKYYNKWLEWRAKIIHDFFEKAKTQVKNINTDIKFGTYTGAWYPTYYDVGANWASKKFKHSTADFSHSMYSSNYSNYGYAEHLDIYMTGVYYNTTFGSGWYTVEGGLANAKKVLCGDVTVAGGLYADIYKNNSSNLTSAVEVCLKKSDGLMVFDIIQLIEYNLWDEVKTGIDNAISADNK